eukprot:1149351-Pelagomonas_calceolata.AAC.3
MPAEWQWRSGLILVWHAASGAAHNRTPVQQWRLAYAERLSSGGLHLEAKVVLPSKTLSHIFAAAVACACWVASGGQGGPA